tara:strand:+ start:3534 stop:4466 length:933 start_codon:yes stop_codon:yes gene_type:complete
MRQLKLFLYICLVRYKSIKLILKKFKKYNISIILDMEDSAQDLFDPKNNENLKQISRKGLEYLSNNDILQNTDIFVRINSHNSKFYIKDIETISEVLEKGSIIKGIFLPKVESYTQIKNCYDQISKAKFNTITIVPMIETKKGLENIDHILLEDKKNNIIKYVHYGHYDFCLDNEFWPFPEPYHIEYWNIIEKISKSIIKNKKKYIHTPFPLIENENIYWSSINYMEKKLDMTEINLSLVNIDINYIKKPREIKQTKLKKISNDNHYKKIFAKKIIDEYLTNKSKNKSFSLSRKRFIPPHLYLGAKKFLS